MSLAFILFNQVGRLRSGWRFGIFAALSFVFSMVLASFASFAASFFYSSTQDVFNVLLWFAFSTSIIFFSAVFAGWFCARSLEELPFASLGWSLRGSWWRDLLLGILLGAASLSVAAGLASLGGGLSFSWNQAADARAILQTAAVSALIFAIGAAGEESLFRGYALQTFVRARLTWLAILLTSVFFALVHSQNPSVSVFGLINTAIAGIWFVVAYLKTRNLWFPFGLHWAWNWTMGAFFGIPVSGIQAIAADPLLQRVDAGPTWLTGGSYGLEGGAACTVALSASTVLIWLAPFLKPTAEMLALTNEENPKRGVSIKSIDLAKNVDDFER